MAWQSDFTLAGSYHSQSLKPNDIVSEADKSAIIEVTVMLRRKNPLPDKVAKGEKISRQVYDQNYSAAKEDADKVEEFAHGHGLSTVSVNLLRRCVILRGKAGDFETAFNTKLQMVNNCMALAAEIKIPKSLAELITGVFGMDSRPAARPMFQVAKKNGKIVSHMQSPGSFTPDQVARLYGFPTGFSAKGQCIGIVELGGGFQPADISNYFTGLKLKVPSVKAISVDGGKNSPSNADSADGEVMLDIEVAGAVANEAAIAVYFAPNTDQGFLDAITTAVHDTNNTPSVISISWGAAEVNWTTQALDNFNEAFKSASALGVSICVSSGDSGSRDGETDGKVHVDFPASSPYVLACGGTHLEANGSKISSETVWHDSVDSATGGGVSTYFPLADYQVNAGVPLEPDTKFKGRGLPDVAANADPNTGYRVLVDGQDLVVGGTSAVAPLMAGLIAIFNEQFQKPSGLIHPQIYAVKGLCRDITVGDNKTTSSGAGYSAGPGWDACTGLGVLSRLESTS